MASTRSRKLFFLCFTVDLEELFPRRFAVGAEITRAAAEGRTDLRDFVAYEHFFYPFQGRFHPSVATRVRDERNIEFEPPVKSFRVRSAVHIHKVADRRYGETILAKKPLIDFYLALVRVIQIVLRARADLLTGSFVVDDDEFSGRRDPHVIDTSSDKEIRRPVKI